MLSELLSDIFIDCDDLILEECRRKSSAFENMGALLDLSSCSPHLEYQKDQGAYISDLHHSKQVAVPW